MKNLTFTGHTGTEGQRKAVTNTYLMSLDRWITDHELDGMVRQKKILASATKDSKLWIVMITHFLASDIAYKWRITISFAERWRNSVLSGKYFLSETHLGHGLYNSAIQEHEINLCLYPGLSSFLKSLKFFYCLLCSVTHYPTSLLLSSKSCWFPISKKDPTINLS